MIDSHIHTHYSHGSNEVFEMANFALKNGFSNIAFAEHFHYDYFDDLGLPTVQGRIVEGTSYERFKLYYKSVERAKEYFKDKLIIRLGVEVDYLDIKKDKIKEALEDKPFKNDYKEADPEKRFKFDFIMGSVHFLGEPLKCFSDYKDNGDDWLIYEYFTATKNCINSGLFDIIAHPELIKYYLSKKEDQYMQYLNEITDLLANKKIAVDLNTDYLRDPEKGEISKERLNPGLMMIKMCKEKNIPLVIGSDAHRLENICKYFNDTLSILKNEGITKLYYLKDRKLISYDI